MCVRARARMCVCVCGCTCICVICIQHFLSQIQQEFDRMVADQHATFLSIKLRWLELQPKLLELSNAEESRHLVSILDMPKEEMDEG